MLEHPAGVRGSAPGGFGRQPDSRSGGATGKKGGIDIGENRVVSGRNVAIRIDGKTVFNAQSIEIRKKAVIHRIRSVFNNDDAALLRTNCSYKVNMTGIRFIRPFENCNFYDLDNFTIEAEIDGKTFILDGCLWDDYLAAADKNGFSEYISVVAAKMITEDDNEGDID